MIRFNRKAKGFTLIEMLVVVVILGILASIVVPRVMGKPDEARITKAQQDIRGLETALNLYKLDNFGYPSTEQGLEALISRPNGQPAAPNWNSGGYIDRLSKDPWGRDYQFLSPGVHGDIDIYSLGKDGQLDGAGIDSDIGNWNSES